MALAAVALAVDLGRARVVDGVSIEVRPGEVVGVFGPSGAGKSTLFRALVGDAEAVGGQVLVFGADATRWPLWRRARRGLGYLPQTPSVLADLTVEENIRSFAALAPGFSAAKARALASEIGLGDRLGVRASSLSGGERRKLELVRVLGASPRAVVCDEPFAALDPAGKTLAGALLRSAADAGAAVIFADHDVREALPLCDRAALLLGGRIACVGPPASFARDEAVIAHYVALPDAFLLT